MLGGLLILLPQGVARKSERAAEQENAGRLRRRYQRIVSAKRCCGPTRYQIQLLHQSERSRTSGQAIVRTESACCRERLAADVRRRWAERNDQDIGSDATVVGGAT